MTATVTAAWPADRILTTLARRGWGEELATAQPGLRTVLTALIHRLPHGSAEGSITINQIADTAHLSARWTSHCLAELETLGLITWRRGWLEAGVPRPGWIRVSKRALADLANRAIGYLAEKLEARKIALAGRLETLKNRTQRTRNRQNPLSIRPELSSPLHSIRVNNGSAEPARYRTNHERIEMEYCAICGKAPNDCEKSNRIVDFELRHDYLPVRTRHAARKIVETPVKNVAEAPKIRVPQGWRRQPPLA